MFCSLVIHIASLAAGGKMITELFTALGLLLVVLLTKYTIIISVRRELKRDTEAFDQAWSCLAQSSFFQTDIAATMQILQDFADSSPESLSQDVKHTFIMPDKCTSGVLSTDGSAPNPPDSFRFANISSASSFSLATSSSYAAAMPAFSVSDLDQLYVRSIILLPMFFRKLVAVGAASKGYCCCVDESDASKQYIMYQDLEQRPEVFKNLYNTSLKRVDRAVNKALIHLHGAVSQITDVVRQSIYFDCLHDLNVALQKLLQDPDLKVMGVRDRLSKMHNGYRDITLHLSFVHSEAMHSNLLGHICELRLSLISLHSMILPGRHEDYLRRKMVLQKTNRSTRGSKTNALLVNVHWKQFIQNFTFAVHTGVFNRSGPNQTSMPTGPSQPSPSASSAPAPAASVSPTNSSPPPLDSGFYQILNAKSNLPGGFLDHMVMSADAGVHDSETASVIFSSRPLTNVIHKRLFQACLVFIGFMLVVNYGIDDYYPVRELRTRTLFSIAHARITVLRRRNPVLANYSALPMHKVSFIKDCSRFAPSFAGSKGSQLFYSFLNPVSAHGWEFYTGSDVSSYSSDPVALEMHVLGESDKVGDPMSANESQWQLKTRFDCNMNARTALCKKSDSNITSTRDVRYSFDLRIAWQCSFELINISFRFVACFGTAIFVNMGRTYWGKTACALAFLGPGIFDLLNLAFTPFSTLEFLHSLSWVLIEVGYGLVMQFKEEYAVNCLPIFALSGSFFNTLFTDLRAGKVIIDSTTIRLNHIVLFSVWLFLWLWRKHLIHQSYKRIEKDMAEYEELWKEVVAEGEATVMGLEMKFAKLQHMNRSSAAFQHLSLCAGPALKRSLLWLQDTLHVQGGDWQHVLGSSSWFGSLTQTMWQLHPKSSQLRVSSLEQLYSQAIIVQPVFFRKLQEIGSRCRCLFPVSDKCRREERYILWSSACEEEEGVWSVKQPSLKSVSRAIQKVIRSYNGDVSRLMDIVRYALIFEDICELSRAVDILLEDPHIEVMRVKNRLSLGYNPKESGGYRDLCINIRISNEETKQFCVSGFRCELQLVLKSFMELRSEKGHKNYRAFRDQRCE
eukprot:768128-Hanusia_phi.AAC.3